MKTRSSKKSEEEKKIEPQEDLIKKTPKRKEKNNIEPQEKTYKKAKKNNIEPQEDLVEQTYKRIEKINIEPREDLVDVNAIVDRLENTALILASKNGNLETVKYLVENGAYVNVFNRFGNTPLMEASGYKARIRVVKYLIENGADVNAINYRGQTVLMEASRNKENLKIVMCLVENGAQVDYADEHGNTALSNSLAYASKNNEISRYLLDISNDKEKLYKALMRASKKGDLKTVMSLKEKGININYKDIEGNSPLYLASKNSHFLLMEYLVENGADIRDIDKEDYLGMTPLTNAIHNRNDEMAKYLIQIRGINSRNNEGLTSLMTVSETDNLELVKYLVENGAEIDTTDNRGETALIYAIKNNKIENVRYLIEKGANINTRDRNGKTVLMLIIKYNDASMITYFLTQRKAFIDIDIDAQDNEGNTALAITVILRRHNNYVVLLIAFGANLNVINYNGESPIDIAINMGPESPSFEYLQDAKMWKDMSFNVLRENIKSPNFFEKINWHIVSRYQNMTADFIKEYKNKINAVCFYKNKYVRAKPVYDVFLNIDKNQYLNENEKKKYSLVSRDNMNDIVDFLN